MDRVSGRVRDLGLVQLLQSSFVDFPVNSIGPKTDVYQRQIDLMRVFDVSTWAQSSTGYELTGREWGVEHLSPLLRFPTPRAFYIFSPPGGRLSPASGPGFWPQVVFRSKNAQNPAFFT